MYTIVGGDGREYGPVTAEQVQAWLAAGRANLATKCKLADAFEWKTVGDFPELAAPPPLGAPWQPPLAGGTAVDAPLAKLDIMHCYERSWNLLKANFWPFVGVTFITWVWTGSLFGMQWHFRSRGIQLLSIVLNPLLVGAVTTFFVRKARGTAAPGLKEFFGNFGTAYGRLLGIYLLMMIFIFIGIICLILPGIYLAVAYQFAYILAVDKGTGVWDSLEGSRRTLKGNWWRMLALGLLGIPFTLIGAACLGVGLLVTTPLILGALYYAYVDLSGPPAA